MPVAPPIAGVAGSCQLPRRGYGRPMSSCLRIARGRLNRRVLFITHDWFSPTAKLVICSLNEAYLHVGGTTFPKCGTLNAIFIRVIGLHSSE